MVFTISALAAVAFTLLMFIASENGIRWLEFAGAIGTAVAYLGLFVFLALRSFQVTHQLRFPTTSKMQSQDRQNMLIGCMGNFGLWIAYATACALWGQNGITLANGIALGFLEFLCFQHASWHLRSSRIDLQAKAGWLRVQAENTSGILRAQRRQRQLEAALASRWWSGTVVDVLGSADSGAEEPIGIGIGTEKFELPEEGELIVLSPRVEVLRADICRF